MKFVVYLLTLVFSFCTFAVSKLSAKDIPSNSRHGLECSIVRKAWYGCTQPGQHSRPCLFQGGMTMETALRITHSLDPTGKKKDYISNYNASEPKYGVLFTDFIRKTVTQKQRRMSNSYTETYQSLISLLNKFTHDNDVTLYTNSINEEFLDDFIIYMQDSRYAQNYVAHNINLCKSMVKKAGLNNYAIDPSYMNVTIDSEDTFAVYLSTIEISRIYYTDRLTRIQQRNKDLFVVGCLTALRYSDYSTLNKENIQDDIIVKVTKKTGAKVHIPMHDIVKDIVKKYDGFPKGTSIQNFNREIRNICKVIGLDDPVTYTYTQGTELKTITVPKYELISSHTARRSGATNMLIAGMQPYQIMAITGHTTEKSFFRYIRVTREDMARQIAGNSYWRI